MHPDKIHEFVDDLEACFWVLLWQATRLFEYEATFNVDELFDEYVESESGGEATGGRQKILLFFQDFKRVTFSCKPLQHLTCLGSRSFRRSTQHDDGRTRPQPKTLKPGGSATANNQRAIRCSFRSSVPRRNRASFFGFIGQLYIATVTSERNH